MTERIAAVSPRLQARIAGVLYLTIIIAAGFAELFVRDRLIDGADAAATAGNILAHESLYRLGAAAVLIYLPCDTAVAGLFYVLFRPVNRGVSLLAAFFRLMMVAILGANLMNLFLPLALLKGAAFSTVFNAGQLQALALAALKLYGQMFFVGMVFFGFHCLLVGYLISRSAFLPRIFGALMAMAGALYLIHSFARFLSPALGAWMFAYIMVPCFLAEFSLTVWLIVKGVNVERWHEQARAAAPAL